MDFLTLLSVLNLVIPAISGLAIATRDDPAEHILLCNCKNNGQSSSQVAYYSGEPSGQPGAAVVAPSNPGSTTWWEGAPQSVAFSDGNVFSWYIAASVPDTTYAGTAKNNYMSFWCYNEWSEFSYTTSDGTTCTVVYDCNHNKPVGPTGDQTSIFYSLSSNYVLLPAAFQTSPQDIFNAVYSKFDSTSGETVDDSSVDLGNYVSIVFTGHGDIPGTTLTGLAKILVDVVSQQSGLTAVWTTHEKGGCEQLCESGKGCCEWSIDTVNHWKIAQTATIYAKNTATNSDQGSLTYTIAYTPPAPDCGLAKAFGNALGAASLFPVVGSIFGTLATGAGVVQGIAGC